MNRYGKSLVVFVIGLFMAQVCVCAQTTGHLIYKRISKAEFEKVQTVGYLLPNRSVKTIGDKLRVYDLIFTDINFGNDIRKHTYLGDVNNTPLFIIKVEGKNETSYRLYSRKGGTSMDFIGMPAFNKDKKYCVCLSDDGKRLMFGLFKDNRMLRSKEQVVKEDIRIVDLRCVGGGIAVAKDRSGKFWQIELKG